MEHVGIVTAISARLHQKSVALVRGLSINMPAMLFGWVAVASFACGLRASFPATPSDGGVERFAALLPYVLVVGVPVAAIMLALHWFPTDRLFAQPDIRLARYGKWRPLDCLSARNLPMFGATGLMASLLLGMVMSIPMRTMEFLLAVPALGSHAPSWFSTLFAAMVMDVVIVSSLYGIAFVMALRHVPWFPRFLLMAWGVDILAQLGIAQVVAGTQGLPAGVATSLQALLDGNLKKVLVSAALWLPYLLVSDRVNLTYRQRVRA
jgi:hypothetical protein